MKKIFLISLLLVSQYTNAKCAFQYSYSMPETGTTLTSNQRILVHGAAIKKEEFSFVSEENTVGVSILKEIKGDNRVDQFLIVPKNPLSPGSKYKLAGTALEWTVAQDLATNKEIKFEKKPEFVKGDYQVYGCGPAAFAYFSYLPSVTNHFVQVELKGDNKIQNGFLMSRENQVAVGFGMCGGEFSLNAGITYQVRFKLLDFYGNESQWSEKISFLSPVKN